MSVITAIPSIATMFSSTPFAFSSSVSALEESPISTLPADTDSIPEPEPVYSTVTVTPGFFSMNDSLSASQSFSIEVLPASESEPLKFSFDVPSSALLSALLSAPSELEPHPVNAAVIIVAAVAKTKSFFIRFFILISSFITFLNLFLCSLQLI